MNIKITTYRIRTLSLLILLTGIVCQSSFAQRINKPIDVLMNELKTAEQDTNKVSILNGLSRGMAQRSKFIESKNYAQDALTLSKKLNFRRGMAVAHINIAEASRNLGSYAEALSNYQASLKIWEEFGDRRPLPVIYNNIGDTYGRRGDYAEALKNIITALKLSESLGDNRGIALSYSSMGVVYDRQGSVEEALKNHLTALEIRQKINDQQGLAATYTHVGLIYAKQGNHAEALKNHQASFRIRNEQGDKRGMAVCYSNIGLVYGKQGNCTEALKNHQASLQINEEIGEKKAVAFCYINIGKTLIRLNQLIEARNQLDKALSLSKEIGAKDQIRDAYHSLSKLDSTAGDFQGALTNYKLYIDNKDSVLNEINSKQIAQMKEQYESEKKDREILQLESDKQKLENEKKLTALLVKSKTDSLLLVRSEKEKIRLENERVEALNLYNEQQLALLANEKKLNELQLEKNQTELLAQKAETEKQQQQLTGLIKGKSLQDLQLIKQRQAKKYLIAAIALLAILSIFVYRNYRTRQQLKLQALRNKIASDLHDDVGSTLSSISIFSQMVQQQSKETIPLLESIGESSRKMLDAMADIVWTINPENDQFEKIISRMKSFAFELLGAKNIDFEFVADENVANMKLPMEVRKNLYLIFKEATNNMVKHAGASKAMFAIKGGKNDLRMMIRDNGKGFDVTGTASGNGLKNMKKRAGEIGGQLTIDSNPGHGTLIEVKIAV